MLTFIFSLVQLADMVKRLLEESIEPVIEEKIVGTSEVKETFTLTLNRKHRKDGMAKRTGVAGCKVANGEARASSLVRVERDGEAIHEGRVISLKSFKQEVKSVRKGQECGVILADYGDFEAGDVLTFYEMVSRRPSLYEGLGDGEGSSRAAASGTSFESREKSRGRSAVSSS